MAMLPVGVMCVLAAVAPLKLAMTDVTAVRVDAKLASVLAEHLAQRFAAAGVQVTTPRDVQSVLGLERQKELLGCAEGGCAVELANALGVDGLILTDLALVGDAYLVNVKVLAANDGRALAAWSTTVSSEGRLIAALDEAVAILVPRVNTATGRGEVEPGVQSGTPRRVAWILVAVGAVIAATSAAPYAVALGRHQQLVATTGPTLTYSQADELRSDGNSLQTASAVLFGLGAVVIVAGLVILLVGGR